MDRLHQGVRAAQRSGKSVRCALPRSRSLRWINDTLGHDLGDALLQEMALRLSRAVRECDTVARLGGDEFAIVLGDLWQVADAEAVAAKIVDAITRPLEVAGMPCAWAAAWAWRLFPFQAHDEESLLRHADLAMYHAKESGGNRHQLFSEQMNARAVERMTVESELRAAIAAGQLELHYQPQLCLEDGRLAGMEALVRWRHPRLGLLAPRSPVPLAEDCGLIWELGLAVLELALAQLAAWDRAGWRCRASR